MKAHTQRVQHSSEKAHWRTPKKLFRKLNEEFLFAVDIAADERSKLCGRYYGPGSPLGEEDGLREGLVWESPGFLNPPYSLRLAKKWREEHGPGQSTGNPYLIENWVRRAHVESWSHGWRGAMIVPYSSQANWFRYWICGFSSNTGHAALEERRLIRRIAFNDPDGVTANSAPNNSVIIIWGPTWGYVGQVVPCVRYWDWGGG